MKLVYDVVLPPNTKPNVVKHTVSYTVKSGDVTAPVSTFEVDVTANPVVVPQVTLLHNDVTSIAETQTDVNGLVSEPSDPFVFTALDDVPPAKPGQVGLKFAHYEA